MQSFEKAAKHGSGPILRAASLESDGSARGTRILLMDDEEYVRQIAASMLRWCSHEVVTVAEGGAAVEAYVKAREEGRPFHVVILDLRVPQGLGGLETMARLRAVDPNVRAVVCSGTLEAPLTKYAEHGFCGALAKPFQLPDLQEIVTSARHGNGTFVFRGFRGL